jgi:hypothetical protein
MFSELTDAYEELEKEVGHHRTYRSQFCDPLYSLLELTHTFLEGCEDLSRINTREKLKAFESYLFEQPKHRMVLIKRIPGSMADEYRDLNQAYQTEMEEIERAEQEAKRRPFKQPEGKTTGRKQEDQRS